MNTKTLSLFRFLRSGAAALGVATLGVATLGVALVAAPAQAQPCVPFQGIDHCAFGPASLDLTPQGLELVKVGGAGVMGGVTSHLPPGTTFWAAELGLEAGPGPWTLFSAVADSSVVARLRFDEIDNGYFYNGNSINNGYLVSLAFSGGGAASSFSVLVYDDGVLQAAVGGVQSDPQVLQTTMPTDDVPGPGDIIILDGPGPWMPDTGGPFPGDDPWPDEDGPTTTFTISGPLGACAYSFSAGADMLIQLPGGQVVTGDELRFEEEIQGQGQGHALYQSFQAMETAIGGTVLTIKNEISNGI